VRRARRLPVEKRPPNRERDIVFLSMVADPERCHALSGNAHHKRFNVAASRARDRMYLVRPVTAEQLSPRRTSG
jgi:superfamily I DNA and/or RNA helicase